MLNSNQLNGYIPESIGGLHKLTTLKLFQNELSGVIPESICALEHVVFTLEDKYKKSNIFDNHLCPPYPECVEEFIGNQDTSQCGEE